MLETEEFYCFAFSSSFYFRRTVIHKHKFSIPHFQRETIWCLSSKSNRGFPSCCFGSNLFTYNYLLQTCSILRITHSRRFLIFHTVYYLRFTVTSSFYQTHLITHFIVQFKFTYFSPSLDNKVFVYQLITCLVKRLNKFNFFSWRTSI